ncbi:DUF1275 domain-containing protein [bacterium]|nr:DUF1275 domain-containing protein [bacterium]
MQSRMKQRDGLLALCLALIAGYVDGYGLVALNTYVSFMSGNTTQTGSMLGQQNFKAAVPTALAISFFLVGSVLGHSVLHSGFRHAQRLLFLWAASLLAIAFITTHWHWMGPNFIISVLSVGMGSMNTALSRLGMEPVNLTFVTGTLNKLGGHLAMAMMRVPVEQAEGSWDTHFYRAILLAAIWTSFILGAIISGVGAAYFGSVMLLPPMTILFLLAITPRYSRS